MPTSCSLARAAPSASERSFAQQIALSIGPVPAHVLTTALYERFASRGDSDYADKLLSALRFQFGGHKEKPTGS